MTIDQQALDGAPKSRLHVFSRVIGNLSFLDFVQGVGLLAVIALFCLVMSFASPVFASVRNIENVLTSATIIAVVAIGQTFVILVAGIDLSVASVLVLSSVLSVGLVQFQGWSPGLAIVAALVTGAIVGLINGLAITKLRIPALIATLATMSAARGLAYIYSGGQNIAPVPDIFVSLQDFRILGIPAVIVITLALAIVAQLVLSRTRFGRSVYATGGNALAARLAGIHTERVVIATFVISGVTAAIGGLLITARFEAGAATAAQGMELAVIAAVVIGGVSLFGGEGNMGGMLLGVLLLGLVQNAVNLLNVPPNWDSVVSGLVIAAAAALDVYRRTYLEAGLRRRVIAAKDAKESGKPTG